MKQFSLYDIVGVLAPGAIVVVGISILDPSIGGFLIHNDLTGGELGLVVLLSYVVGNVVAGLSNIIERPYWALIGGIHTARAQKNDGKIISFDEFEQLQRKLKAVGIMNEGEAIQQLEGERWWGVTRQIDSFLEGRKLTERVQLFNAQFGMNRGVAVAFLIILAMTIMNFGTRQWKIELLLAVCSAVSIYRMHTFSLHYAQRLFRTFLTAPEKAQMSVSSKTKD
jgi:hypothetical protein